MNCLKTLTMKILHTYFIFSSKFAQQPPCWSNTDHLTNDSPPSRLNVSCIFKAYPFFFSIPNQSSWQVSGVSRASQCSMNHSCCLAHSCLGASGLGRSWPNGEATWQLQMFCFCICIAHQKQQAMPPKSLCHLWESRQRLLKFPSV